MKIGSVFAAFKAWSNFRLMVLIGVAFTLLSLLGGALYVRTAITGSEERQAETEQAERRVDDSRAARDSQNPAPAPTSSASPGGLAKANENLPTADRGEDFQVTCAPVGTVSQSGTPPVAGCRISSYSGFSGKVDLSCASAPPGLGCEFTPRSVTAPANGTVPFQLRLTPTGVSPGSYLFDVVGRSGRRINTFSFPLNVSATTTLPSPPPAAATVTPSNPQPNPTPSPSPSPSPAPTPTFNIACTLQPGPESAIDKLLWSLTQGAKGTIKCLVTPLNGFDEEVTLSLANVSDQVQSNFTPPILQLANGVAEFVDLNFELGGLEKGKEYTFDVTGTSASQTLVKRVVLTVTE